MIDRMMIIIAVGVMCAALSGCDLYPDKENYELTYDKKNDELYESYISTFDSTLSSNDGSFNEKQLAVLESDFEKVDNIKFIQQSNGRNVTVYKSRLLPGFYILCDGEWTYIKCNDMSRLKNCDELYESLEGMSLVPMRFTRGNNGTGIIVCQNTEYTVMDFEYTTAFSVNYDDVDFELENMPLAASIYEKDGKAERVEIITPVTAYKDSYSDKNIKDIKELFTRLGLDDEALSAELEESLTKGSYTAKIGDCTVISNRNAKAKAKFKYNVFCVDMAQ